MKGTLEFDLPDDHYEHMLAVRAPALHAAMCEFSEYLRGQEKYVEAEKRDALPVVRRVWHEMMGDLLDT